MSILSEILSDIRALFFPPRCPVCGERMERGEACVCTLCRATAPLTGFWTERDNPVARKFWGQLPVEQASAFLFYTRNSRWRLLIHAFKYRGMWRRAYEMGCWYGRCLSESGLSDGFDTVVPLPLHPLRLCRRGYNQAELIARGIAEQLGAELDTRSVRRRRNTDSQARTPKSERGRNVAGAFVVRRPERLAGRRVLLVDDVLTTGHTMSACAEAILRAVPDCRIGIAALASPPGELGIKG